MICENDIKHKYNVQEYSIIGSKNKINLCYICRLLFTEFIYDYTFLFMDKTNDEINIKLNSILNDYGSFDIITEHCKIVLVEMIADNIRQEKLVYLRR